MGLPAQIQRQVVQAEEIERALAQPAVAEAAPTPAAPAANEPETPPVTSAPEPAPAPTTEPKRDEAFARLEQQYRTLQGMWGSANVRLQAADAKITDLTQKLAEAVSKLEAKAAPAPEPQQKFVTDKDAEAFGTDLIDLARRAAREEFSPKEAQYLAEINDLKAKLSAQDQTLGTVTQTQAATAQQAFYAGLDTGLPQWETIQNTPECQQWLSSRVPGTQYTWNQALQDAAGAFDAPRALEVFTTFLAMNPTLDPRKKSAEPPKRAELEKQIAPPKSGTGGAGATSKPSIPLAEYQSKMLEVVRLNKARLYDKARELETELNNALAEGRVT